MNRFKNLLTAILGERRQNDEERYFMTLTAVTASIFLFILTIVHIKMELRIAPVYLAGSSAFIFFIMYLVMRFKGFVFYPKLIITLSGLLFLDFTWYSKFLSFGPVLFFVLIFGALVIWVWEGRALMYMMMLYFSNIIILFLIEYNTDQFHFEYVNLQERTVDIYISFLLYSSLFIFLLYILKKEFIRQRDQAQKSDRLKSAFLANMSHEIRTPMNAIVGFSELLEVENDPETQSEYLNIIKSSSSNLLKLISDIIDLSKIELGDIGIYNDNFSVKTLFEEMRSIYAIELKRRLKTDVSLIFNITEDDYTVHSDLLRVRQIISNLLTNAVKFTIKGQIACSCSKEGSHYIFSISDTGVGIPEADQTKIFDQFVNFNYGGLNTEGTGIGLSIVKRLVALLKGEIWLQSELGVGSTFSFSIPESPQIWN